MKLNSAAAIIATLIAFNATGNNDNLSAKISGNYEVQAGTYNSNLSSKYPLTPNQQHFGLNSMGNFNIDISNTLDNGIIYGGIIGLEITTRNNRKVPSMLYFTSDYGKFEFGSNKSANSKMRITAYSLSAATAGGWDSWAKLTENQDDVNYISSYGNFLDLKTRKTGKVEYSRKITYFTPKYNGWQLGISYIPDTSNVGYDGLSPADHHHEPVKPSNYNFATKNGFAYGLTYEHKFTDIELKLAAVGENGKTSVHLKKAKTAIYPEPKFKDLFTYTVGTEISYERYSLAAAYGSYNKSLTSVQTDQYRDTHLYSIGAKYHFDPIITSVNYFYSDHKKNTLHATTLALDYKIINGVVTYGEFTYYKTSGKFIKNAKLYTDKTSGTVVLLGIKIGI